MTNPPLCSGPPPPPILFDQSLIGVEQDPQCQDRFSMTVVLLSSEPPAVSGKMKLWKLIVKRRRDWGGEKKKWLRNGINCQSEKGC